MKEIFLENVRSHEDIAGVYEFDGTSGYFYLHKLEPSKVIAALEIHRSEPTAEDLALKWDVPERLISLWEKGERKAVYDCETGAIFGGRQPITEAMQAMIWVDAA